MSTATETWSNGVSKLYDEMAELIEVQGSSIHVGYWLDENDRTPLLEAINRCTDVVVGKLELRPGQRLLDIGCGVAMPAIRLAQRTDADITGVTNSQWQVNAGTQLVGFAGLRGQVRVELGDAAALSYPDDSFDAVLMFQSLQHAQDRKQWLREMVRVVKPGGRAVLTDFTAEAPLSSQEIEILHGGSMIPPQPVPSILEEVRSCGLTIDEAVSCGDRIRPSYPAYFERLTRMRPALEAAIGKDKVDGQEQAMRHLLPIYHDKIGYVIITGHKPE
ncbi:MAG: methyltransferase domain-containing protein [Streptosporangiaceae bacterium]|nr:methyltransferase domain-containing protein [Streptosporangiaceae bacterium]